METDTLLEQIERMSLNPDDGELTADDVAFARLPRRLQNAIQRVRWHICGLFGVKIETVTHKHVAAFSMRLVRHASYLWEHFDGLGLETRDQLAAWSRNIIQPAARASRWKRDC